MILTSKTHWWWKVLENCEFIDMKPTMNHDKIILVEDDDITSENKQLSESLNNFFVGDYGWCYRFVHSMKSANITQVF